MQNSILNGVSMEYQHKNTSISIVNYHIVFCPKYRRGLLVGKIKMRLEKIIRDVALENDWEVIAKEIMPDHVHLFVGADTRTPPEIVVKRFKGRSSRHLRNEFPELLKYPLYGPVRTSFQHQVMFPLQQ